MADTDEALRQLWRKYRRFDDIQTACRERYGDTADDDRYAVSFDQFKQYVVDGFDPASSDEDEQPVCQECVDSGYVPADADGIDDRPYMVFERQDMPGRLETADDDLAIPEPCGSVWYTSVTAWYCPDHATEIWRGTYVTAAEAEQYLDQFLAAGDTETVVDLTAMSGRLDRIEQVELGAERLLTHGEADAFETLLARVDGHEEATAAANRVAAELASRRGYRLGDLLEEDDV